MSKRVLPPCTLAYLLVYLTGISWISILYFSLCIVYSYVCRTGSAKLGLLSNLLRIICFLNSVCHDTCYGPEASCLYTLLIQKASWLYTLLDLEASWLYSAVYALIFSNTLKLAFISCFAFLQLLFSPYCIQLACYTQLYSRLPIYVHPVMEYGLLYHPCQATSKIKLYNTNVAKVNFISGLRKVG